MKRILIIGAGGSGKSTLALRLGKLLSIDVIHLDKFYWRSGWVEPAKEEWQKTLDELLKHESWIMDGNYSGTLPLRLRACDTILFLDLPRSLCVWRVFKRLALYRNKDRPDMAPGCPEKFSLEFILWVWNYPTRTRPKVVELISAEGRTKHVLWLRSQRQVEDFLASL